MKADCLEFIYVTIAAAILLVIIFLIVRSLVLDRRELKILKGFKYGEYLYFHYNGQIVKGYVHRNDTEKYILAMNLDGVIVDVEYKDIILEF